MLITLPESPTKGTSQEYILNLDELISLISVNHFKNKINWTRVIVLYKSTVLNQKNFMSFTEFGGSESSHFTTFSSLAFDYFNIEKIIIVDIQNATYSINSSSIPDVSSYLINFTGEPLVNYVNYDLTNGPLSDEFGGVIANGFENWFYIVKSSDGYDSDFELTFEFLGEQSNEIAIGISKNTDIINNDAFQNSVTLVRRFGYNYFEWQENGSFIASSYNYNETGNNVVTFSRVGTTLSVIFNDVEIRSQEYTGTVYPLARPYFGIIDKTYDNMIL